MDLDITLFWILTFIFLLVSVFFITFIIFFNQKVLKKNEAIRQLEEKRKVELLKNTIEIQEKERARLGADLHDDLGPMLSTIKMHINQLHGMEKDNTNVHLISTYLDETISGMREISKNLFPAILKEFGLKVALKDLSERVSTTDKIKVHLEFCDEWPKINEDVELGMYRITQEFVNNSIKHAAASVIDIQTHCNEEHISLSVTDNGSGFEVEKLLRENKGIGLRSMELRCRSMNAEFDFQSQPGKGTSIIIIYPLHNNEFSNQIRNTG